MKHHHALQVKRPRSHSVFLPAFHILMLGHIGSVQRSDANPVVKPVSGPG